MTILKQLTTLRQRSIFNLRLLLMIGLVISALLPLGIFYQTSGKIKPQFMDSLPKTKLKIGQTEVVVELATTDEQRTKGLSGRKKLGKNEGMLFVFEGKYPFGFWMKGMNFPLDFIWIDDDRVVEITENVAPSKGLKWLGKVYRPSHPVNRVLEVNSSFVKQNKIKIGDRVEFDKNLEVN